jgi:Transposase and inactivated derivatives
MPKKNPEKEARRERRRELTEFLDKVGVNDVAGVQDLFKELVGTILENGLEGELDAELGYSKYDYRNKDTENSRNGHSEKTVRSSFGEMELAIPRDRKGEYEPQLVKKYQTSLSGDIEEKILYMYAKGMSTSDIEAHIREIYMH